MINIDEEYRFIKNYEDYIITKSGKVYSNKNNKLKRLKEKGINNDKRYLQVVLCKNNNKKYMQIHRLVGESFVDGYFDGAVINHIDGNIHNNNYDNLEWTTQKDNIHKGYKTSGINQYRNFKYWKIIYPNGCTSHKLKGRNEINQYIKDNNLNASFSSLIKYKKDKKGFLLKEVKE